MEAAALIDLVRTVIADELDVPLEALENNRSLRREYGLDSVAAVNIIFALEAKLGTTIDMRDLASVDSIKDLEHLLERNKPVVDNLTKRVPY